MRQLDAGQNIDAGVQYRMPTKDYVCTDRAQQEQQHFFRDHPHVVGLSNDLPENGCFYTVDELGIPILTTRDQTGRFRAFLNACRHRSARVVSETRGIHGATAGLLATGTDLAQTRVGGSNCMGEVVVQPTLPLANQ